MLVVRILFLLVRDKVSPEEKVSTSRSEEEWLSCSTANNQDCAQLLLEAKRGRQTIRKLSHMVCKVPET